MNRYRTGWISDVIRDFATSVALARPDVEAESALLGADPQKN